MAERRRRPIMGVSGLVLFACMFLPAVRGCNHEMIFPISLPPVLPPYLLGLGFGCAALFARTEGGLKGWIAYLRVILILFLVECLIAIGKDPQFGLLILLAPATMLGSLGLRGARERRVAGAAMICGLAGTIWFGLWCSDRDAMIGVWVSLFSSIGLVIGGISWITTPGDLNESDLPRATVISSGQ